MSEVNPEHLIRQEDEKHPRPETKPLVERYSPKVVAEIIGLLQTGYNLIRVNEFKGQRYETELTDKTGASRIFTLDYPWPFLFAGKKLGEGETAIQKLSAEEKKVAHNRANEMLLTKLQAVSLQAFEQLATDMQEPDRKELSKQIF